MWIYLVISSPDSSCGTLQPTLVTTNKLPNLDQTWIHSFLNFRTFLFSKNKVQQSVTRNESLKVVLALGWAHEEFKPEHKTRLRPSLTWIPWSLDNQPWERIERRDLKFIIYSSGLIVWKMDEWKLILLGCLEVQRRNWRGLVTK